MIMVESSTLLYWFNFNVTPDIPPYRWHSIQNKGWSSNANIDVAGQGDHEDPLLDVHDGDAVSESINKSSEDQSEESIDSYFGRN